MDAVMDAKLNDEAGRLAALYRYDVLDTPREEPFERITGLVQTVLQVPIATVSLIDAKRQWYKSCVGMENTELARENSFCTHTIRSRDPLVISDTLLDSRFAHLPSVTGDPFIRSYAGVPLPSPDGYNLGSLCALDRKPRDFEPSQVAVLKSFAALVLDELELRRLAEVDSLTGVATRRSFLAELDKVISGTEQGSGTHSVLVLDVDHFKRINDTFGHSAGDTVLRDVSQVASGLLRSGDLMGRLGGEEFGILLKDVSLKQAVETAERLRLGIEAFTHSDVATRVTASFGVAGLESRLSTPHHWLAAADQALYEAKRAGRNRVCAAALQQVVLASSGRAVHYASRQ